MFLSKNKKKLLKIIYILILNLQLITFIQVEVAKILHHISPPPLLLRSFNHFNQTAKPSDVRPAGHNHFGTLDFFVGILQFRTKRQKLHHATCSPRISDWPNIKFVSCEWKFPLRLLLHTFWVYVKCLWLAGCCCCCFSLMEFSQ